MSMTLALRQAATEQVLAKFRDKPFDWKGANCIRLARAQAKAMGHEVPPVPVFRTPLGAKRALKKQGVETVTELLDAHFERLPSPAFAWLGDLLVLEGDPEHQLEAVGIADGQGNVWAWSGQNDHQCLVPILFASSGMTGAWRL